MLRWLKHLKPTKPTSNTQKDDVNVQFSTPSETSKADVPSSVNSENHQKIIELIKSDDIQNHKLASVMSEGIPIEWNALLISSICSSAAKLSFWINEKSSYDFTSIEELTIGPRFFTKYAQIDEFSQLLKNLIVLKRFRWDAGPYWNVLKVLNHLSECESLEEIVIKKAKIHFFPQSILQCKHLKKLTLSDNQIIEIPEELEHFQDLTYLCLSGNRLSRCPRVISKLKKLEVLDLRDNPIKTINPKILGRLYKLRDLRLPPSLAKHYFNELNEWLPEVNFQTEHWQFEDDTSNNF